MLLNMEEDRLDCPQMIQMLLFKSALAQLTKISQMEALMIQVILLVLLLSSFQDNMMKRHLHFFKKCSGTFQKTLESTLSSILMKWVILLTLKAWRLFLSIFIPTWKQGQGQVMKQKTMLLYLISMTSHGQRMVCQFNLINGNKLIQMLLNMWTHMKRRTLMNSDGCIILNNVLKVDAKLECCFMDASTELFIPTHSILV